MVVGVPREVKEWEGRVALTPEGARVFGEHGHTVLAQAGAGEGCRIPDRAFREAGARVLATAEEVFGGAELVLKVKEPQPSEYGLLRRGQILFTYLHLAASRKLVRALLRSGVSALGYETVQMDSGELPLLAPMSEIAGKLSVQIGAHLLEAQAGGRGVLLSGAAGVSPAEVAVIGCGTAGMNAVKVAVGMGAHVTALDIKPEQLRRLDQLLGGRAATVQATAAAVERAVVKADLVIGAVLVPGARAPKVVTREMVRGMKPGSVIIDIAIDQGGCVETIRATSFSEPSYVRHGVIHYAVPNIPAAVPWTGTHALGHVTLPWALEIAERGLLDALRGNPALARGLNAARGKAVHRAVAEACGMRAADWESLLGGSD
jgi:alanine dehydrogenase